MGHRAYNRCVLCEGDVGRVPSRGARKRVMSGLILILLLIFKRRRED